MEGLVIPSTCIDFNDNLKKSYRNRYCIYRNLELGHEIHVWNENSLLLKKAMSQLNLQSKEYLSSLSFQYTYEYYKLFLMLHIEGWFIEEDMIIYDKINNTCKIYEIKHSSKVVENQTRYLKDEDKCLLLEKRFGKIIGKYVLYKGENLISDDITYLNVEDFLCEN